MFHRRISLYSVLLLLLLVNFVSGFRLELMCLSLIVSTRSNLTQLHGFQLIVLLLHRNHFFRLHQQNKSSESKVKFRLAINRCKRVLEASKFAYANKTKKSITSQKPGSRDFWRIANSVLNKGKSAIPSLFSDPEMLSYASDKGKIVC